MASILTILPQSTCHSAPVCEILSKSDHPQQKKMTSYRFSRRRISTILDFRGPIMGSLKSPGTTSYRASIDTTALNCLDLRNAFFKFWRQTDEQMDSTDALSRPRYRERRLNNSLLYWCRHAKVWKEKCVRTAGSRLEGSTAGEEWGSWGGVSKTPSPPSRGSKGAL